MSFETSQMSSQGWFITNNFLILKDIALKRESDNLLKNKYNNSKDFSWIRCWTPLILPDKCNFDLFTDGNCWALKLLEYIPSADSENITHFSWAELLPN